MQKQLISAVALAASLLASFAVQAADTAELKVKGVIRPASCAPSFTGGGVVDYGVIPASTLKAGQFTTLPTKDVTMNITCDATTKVAFKAVDNRQSSVISGLMQYPEENFGLGAVGGKNTGGYSIRMTQPTGDGANLTLLATNNNGQSWGSAAGVTKIHMFSFGNNASTPGAYKQLSAKISLTAYINKPEELDLTREIPLDGSATIEVVYL
ncbi:DUF1120 domain-containing protein [Herbaspirillum lusitanum]|uniref:DUF1120 domain-containing protein n=1 Tax=Herbaspirillum lusitanum TaxID=213312 RepID=A0ABW9A326_9BURK